MINKKETVQFFLQSLLVKVAKGSLDSAPHSKVLGNAIVLARSKEMPEKIELVANDSFMKMSDQDKKVISAFLEKMKFPGFDFSAEFLSIVKSVWQVKNTKKQNESKKQDFKKSSNKLNSDKNNQTNKNASKNKIKVAKAKPAEKSALTVPNVTVKKKRVIEKP